MNHDYAHCLDYKKECPKECFRAELQRDIEENRSEFIGVPLTYSHLGGTEECELAKDTDVPDREVGKWIPVSEGLPEDTVIVTVETKTSKHRYVCEAIWIPRWTWKAEFDNWEDCSEYNEDEDEYYVLEGWYERVHNWDEYSFVGIEDNVIAWMPLPKPWKGEEG